MNFETKSLIMYMAHVHEPPAQPSWTQLSREKFNKTALPCMELISYFDQHYSGWPFFAIFQTRISYFFTMALSY